MKDFLRLARRVEFIVQSLADEILDPCDENGNVRYDQTQMMYLQGTLKIIMDRAEARIQRCKDVMKVKG